MTYGAIIPFLLLIFFGYFFHCVDLLMNVDPFDIVEEVCPNVNFNVGFSNCFDGDYIDEGFQGDFRMRNVLSPNQIMVKNSSHFEKQACFCDQDCLKYGDCCKDLMQREYKIIKNQYSNNIWKCTEFPMKSTDRYFYTIGKCPQNYTNTDIRVKCEFWLHGSGYYVQYLPALSTLSGKIYRNVYCAVCNNDIQLHKLSLEFECNFNVFKNDLSELYLKEDNFDPDKLSWKFMHKGVLTECKLKMQLFEDEIEKYINQYSSRICKSKIDTCNADFKNTSVAKFCAMYSNQVGEYKNYYCGKCNGATMSDVCSSTVEGYSITPTFLLPFAVLFDFDLSSGDSTGSVRLCNAGELYDSIKKHCVAIQCLTKMEDGRCAGDDCTRVSFNADDYVILENKSVVVKSDGALYAPGDYQLLHPDNFGGPKLIVCSGNRYITRRNKFTFKQFVFGQIILYISIICLSLHIICYGILPKLRNIPGKNLISLSSSLLLSQLLFVYGIDRTSSHTLCYLLAVVIHYFLLAYFFWMNVMAYDVHKTFSNISSRTSSGRRQFIKYSTYAWSMPFCIIATAILLDNVLSIESAIRPRYGESQCMISSRTSLIMFNIIPIGTILITNTIFFILTIYHIRSSQKFTCSELHKSETIRFALYVKLAVLMGLSWTLQLISGFLQNSILFYVSTVINGLQGSYVFLGFCCKRKVYDLLKIRLGWKVFERNEAGSSRKLATSSTNFNVI